MKLNNESKEIDAKPDASKEFQWALASSFLIMLIVLSIINKNLLLLKATFLAIIACYLLMEIGIRLLATAFLILSSFLDPIIALIRGISIKKQRGHFPSFQEGIANIWRCESII